MIRKRMSLIKTDLEGGGGVCIRLWGAYPEGMSFAILLMNSMVPLINKYVKPKRFGVK